MGAVTLAFVSCGGSNANPGFDGTIVPVQPDGIVHPFPEPMKAGVAVIGCLWGHTIEPSSGVRTRGGEP